MTRWVLPVLLLAASTAQAQVQRSFQNLGFEQPVLTAPVPANGCYVQVTDAQVPGWSTNHPVVNGGGNCTTPVPANGSLIELWRTNFQGVLARTGNNFAELNAEAITRMSQSICLVQGEVVRWQLSHRARVGTDVMSFNIDSSANQIMRASTTTAGAGSVVAGSCGTGLVGSATCNAPTTANTWGDYTGTFTWNGTSATHSFGFEAISTGSGNNTVGNFLDEIQVTLAPYIQLSAASGSGRENGGGVGIPTISVTGNLTAPLVVSLQFVAGSSTATLGTDFTTPGGTANYTVTIPAGNYDGGAGSQFGLGITVIDDAIIENNETIVVNLVASPANYTITSTQTCGAAAISQLTYTVTDNDVDLLTTKTRNGSATPPGGGTVQFTVTYQNNTARPLIGDLAAHDAVATLADALPTGFTAFAWACTASGTPAPVCPAASGSGAINATAILPAGNNAAGGILTYVIIGTLAPAQCTSTTNTSTVTPSAPLVEGTTSQNTGTFTTPLPGGVANNTATASVDPACTDLAITKTNTPAAGPNDQAADTVTSATQTTYDIVVTNNGPDVVSDAVVRDPAPTGLGSCVLGAPACSATGGATCPAVGAGAGQLSVANLQAPGGVLIPLLPASGSVTIRLACTVQ
ncbi:MAG: DUF11 domain-containing protein [Lysobacter sp.]|nr:DUF11 domain-containing protein [Lysobacter sp.]